MLETVLTRIILRYAKQYICDTVRTDSLSLWGGDLRIQNFELRTEELAKALGAEESSLRLTRGFVRELRVVVPWNAIRSQSLRVEVHAVDVVFASGAAATQSSATAGIKGNFETDEYLKSQTATTTPSPSSTTPAPKENSGETLDETSETWLQPLLRNILGNVAVTADTLVAKLLRNGAVGTVTVDKLDSKPHSPVWQAGFTPVAVQQPILYRVVSVRDVTVSLDNVPQASQAERRSLGGGLSLRPRLRHGKSWASRAPRQVALPIIPRVSAEAFVEFPWLPWSGSVASLPVTRLGLHLSPVRARLTTDQAQLLAQLLRPELPARPASSLSGCCFDAGSQVDSESDRHSMQCLTTSEPSTTAATEPTGSETKSSLPSHQPSGRKTSSLQLGELGSPRPEYGLDSMAESTSSCPATPSSSASAPASSAGRMFGRKYSDEGKSLSLQKLTVAESELDADTTASPLEDNRLPSGSSSTQETSSKAEDSNATGNGFRSFWADVLFGDDDDDEDEDDEGGGEGAAAVVRETRRAWSFAACAPLLALRLEQSIGPTLEETSLHSSLNLSSWGVNPASSAASGIRETCWACTLSLIGLSAAALCPPDGALEPVEGSVELHHVSLHAPGAAGPAGPPLVAVAWGSPLVRSPLENDHAFALSGNQAAASASASSSASSLASKVASTESLRRAASWVEAGRRLLGACAEFPHTSYHALGVPSFSLLNPATRADQADGMQMQLSGGSDHDVATGHAAIRIGLLLVPAGTAIVATSQAADEAEEEEATEEGSDDDEIQVDASGTEDAKADQSDICRLSVQLSDLNVCLEPSWLAAVRETLQPLCHSSPEVSASSTPAGKAQDTSCGNHAEEERPATVIEVIVCSDGLSVSLGPFDLHLGPVRLDWRSCPHNLDEALLATTLRETTVFISGALTHVPGSSHESGEGEKSLVMASLTALCLGYTLRGSDSNVAEAERGVVAEINDVRFAAALPIASSDGAIPAVTHLETSLSSAAFRLALKPIASLQNWALLMAAAVQGQSAPQPSGIKQEVAEELSGSSSEPTFSLEICTVHGSLCLASHQMPQGSERADPVQGVAITSAQMNYHRQSGVDLPHWPSSSDSEAEDAPSEISHSQSPAPPPRLGVSVLQTQQLLFSLRRLRLTFCASSTQKSRSILASYDLREQESLVARQLGKITGKLSSLSGPEHQSRPLPDAALALAIQLCPVSLPVQARTRLSPPLQLLPAPRGGAFGAETLQRSGGFQNLCLAWLGSLHIELMPEWVLFAQELAEGLSSSSESHGPPMQRAAPETLHGLAPTAGQAQPPVAPPISPHQDSSESLGSLALCLLHAVVLPSSVWLVNVDGKPVACMTLPSVVAADNNLQIDGLRVNLLDEYDGVEAWADAGSDGQDLLQVMPLHSVRELERCLAQATASNLGSIPKDSSNFLALERGSLAAWRRELNGEDASPLVSLDMQLSLSPLQVCVQPQQLASLASWAMSLRRVSPEPVISEVEVRAAEPAVVRSVPSQARLRIAFSFRAMLSLEASLELRQEALHLPDQQQPSQIQLRLPCISATLRHSTDASQPHGHARLRLSRPHLALLRGEAIRNLEIVEWCEEKVVGGDELHGRSASWLVAHGRWRGEMPLSLSISSLPLGLCVALRPLLNFALAYVSAFEATHPESSSQDSSTRQAPSVPPTVRPKPEIVEASAQPGHMSMQLQAALGAISLRLFAGDPCDPCVSGAAHLVACLAEASGHLVGGSMQARAVVSLSLFEQPGTTSEQPLCLIDDLLAPCTLTLLERHPSASENGTVGLGAQGGLLLELKHVDVDLGKRSHLCRLLQLVHEYLAVIPPNDSASQAESTSAGAVACEHPSAASQQVMELAVHSITLKLPAADDGEELCSFLGIQNLRCSLGALRGRQQQSLHCDHALARLAGKHQVIEISKLDIDVLSGLPESAVPMEITVTVDGGVASTIHTGRLMPDLASLVPSALEIWPGGGPNQENAEHASLEGSCQTKNEPAAPEAAKSGKAPGQGVGLKLRVLLSALDLDLRPAVAESPCKQRSLMMQVLGASLFFWPPDQEGGQGARQLPTLCRQCMDLSVEVFSATASGREAANKKVPLLSPLSFDGSLVLLAPTCPGTLPGRTELTLRLSPMLISAGAWQLALIIDVASLQDPDQKPAITEPQASDPCHTDTPHTPAGCKDSDLASARLAANPQRFLLDVWLDAEDRLRLSEADLSALPEFWQEAAVKDDIWPVPVLKGIEPSELQPWQAARVSIEDAARSRVKMDEAARHCPSYALRLGCPSRIASVYVVRSRHRGEASPVATPAAEKLQACDDYEVDAWDDAFGRFVPIIGPAAEGYAQGDAVLESMAQHSHLLRLRLPALAREHRGLSERLSTRGGHVLLELEALNAEGPSSSDLAISVEVPQLTWSVLNSGSLLEASAACVPKMEEPFGDFSFLAVRLGVWQGANQGLAIGVASERARVELYDMSRLSLVPVVIPEENFVEVAVRLAEPQRPQAVALRTLLERRQPASSGTPVIDVNLGAWRLATPAWAVARLVEMGNSLARVSEQADTTGHQAVPLRLPVVIRNALPISLIFGQHGSPEEALDLPAGGQRAYAWRHAASEDRQLFFRREHRAPRSASLPLSDNSLPGRVAWASFELLPAAGESPTWHVCVCVRRSSCAQLEVEILPPMLIKSDLCFALEFQLLGAGELTDDAVNQTNQEPSARSDAPLYAQNTLLDERHYLKGFPLAAKLGSMSKEAETGQQVLFPGSLIGVLSSSGSRVRFRDQNRSYAWSLALPIIERPLAKPFTTLLTFHSEDGSAGENIVCSCQDLWGVPREEQAAASAATEHSTEDLILLCPDADGAPLPQVLWLKPLLHFQNRSAVPMALVAMPLGNAVAGAGESTDLQGLGDPRQLRNLELQVLSSCDSVGMGQPLLTSGQMMLTGLTQFPFTEADELVSWRNSVSFSSVSLEPETEPPESLMMLVEIGRCRISGLVKRVAVEPMWCVRNETGCEIFLAHPSRKAGGSLQPHVLHTAPIGESWTSSLGELQHNPTFPLVALFGVHVGPKDDGEVVWVDAARSCGISQTTTVDIRHGSQCFRVLVCLEVRKRAGLDASSNTAGNDGGIQMSLYAAAYVRGEQAVGLGVQLGASQEEVSCAEILQLPALVETAPVVRGADSFVPLPWLPVGVAALLCEQPRTDEASSLPSSALLLRLRSECADALLPPGPWGMPLELKALRKSPSRASTAVASGGAVPAGGPTGISSSDAAVEGCALRVGPAVSSLRALLLAEEGSARRCSGQLRDVLLELPGNAGSSSLLNVAYHVHGVGCLVLTLLPSKQPPLMCANFSNHTVWISEAWKSLPQNSSQAASPAVNLGAPPQGSWRRVVPGCSMELPCPLLRTLEVFPASGAGPSETQPTVSVKEALQREVVMARLSLDPEADAEAIPEDCNFETHARWHTDVDLGTDADLRWWPPLPDDLAAPASEVAPPLVICVRCAAGVTRVELRDGEEEENAACHLLGDISVPRALPRRGCTLPQTLDVFVHVKTIVLHVPVANAEGRALALHADSACFGMREEQEVLKGQCGMESRKPVSRQLLSFRAALLSVAELSVARSSPASVRPAVSMRQVLTIPQMCVEARLYNPSYNLPTCYELLRLELCREDLDEDEAAEEREPVAIKVRLDDGMLQLFQALADEFGEEFAVGTVASDTKDGDTIAWPVPGEDFRYISVEDFCLASVPIIADLRLSAPVFVSFTGLSLSFPEIRLSGVVTTTFLLGQELIAHCIAFLLLNSPAVLGSCDLFGNPVQAYRHLRSGIGDLLQRPLSEGLGSFAWHTASASLLSISAVCDSLRRNLPSQQCTASAGSSLSTSMPGVAAPASVATAATTSVMPHQTRNGSSANEVGLKAGARALLDGVGRGLVGVVRWEQHTPERLGTLGALRGARNAIAGAVAHPVGGLLDFVTAATRGWAVPDEDVDSTGRHPSDCQACLGLWPLRPSPDVSPAKFYLHCCQGLGTGQAPAVLFWSPRCELVSPILLPQDNDSERRRAPSEVLPASIARADSSDSPAAESNLRLVRAGVLLTSAQLCVLVDSVTAHVLDIGEVKAVEEARGQSSGLVTVASSTGRIWQLHVRGERGARSDFVAHLRRARRLLGLPPAPV